MRTTPLRSLVGIAKYRLGSAMVWFETRRGFGRIAMRVGGLICSSILSLSSSSHSSIHRSLIGSIPADSRIDLLGCGFTRFGVRRVASMATSFRPEIARVPPAVALPTPPITKFKIGLCQLSVTADKQRNIEHARKAIGEAAAQGAKLVVLPEIWNGPYSNDSFPVYAEDIDAGGDASPSTVMLSEVSRLLQITIVGGSIPERCGDRLYNTCCVFGTDGKLKAKHRKIHLFDIDIPGKITFKESLTLTAGESPTVVDTDVGRIGIGICYDIRFQELAVLYAARGAHLICYPGAFNMTTGPLHWELLQRARATDNQLYVATCSPARDAGAGYVAWGHSTLVGPFGEVLAKADENEAIIVSEIDYSNIELRRTNLPLEKQRRGDLYQLVDVQRSSGKSENETAQVMG